MEDRTPITNDPTRRHSRLLPLGIAALALLVVIGALGTLGNVELSSTYSADAAVRQYFAAEAKHDAAGMLANATYVRGDGSYAQLFDRDALTAMLRLPANSDVRAVRIDSETPSSASARDVHVTLTSAGGQTTSTYRVLADPGQAHFVLYHSWRVQIPAAHIHLTVPSGAGPIDVDGIVLPAGASTADIAVIPGFHSVTMSASGMLAGASAVVDARKAAAASLPGKLSDTAAAAAKSAVLDTFKTACDPAKYDDCPGHTYKAPDQNYIYYFTLPGYGNVNYSTYVVNLLGDPTAGMQVVLVGDSKVNASGACRVTYTVDGSRQYALKGTWTAVLTWRDGGFDTDMTPNCEDAKA